MKRRDGLVRAAGLLLSLSLASAAAAADAPDPRWTADTPDAMLDHALARAARGGDDALAALVVAASLDDRASFGRARDGLSAIAASSSPFADEAKWLRLSLLAAPPLPAWPGVRALSYDAPPNPDGLVKAFAVLGPFQDAGGGLARKEGPEAPGQSFGDAKARFSWGVYDVAWRRALPEASTARGLPLDLYVFPRNESCTYVASKVAFPAPRSVVVHVGSAGSVRVLWDGASIASSDDVHPQLVVDRLSAKIAATAGDHLVAVKICSGSMPDDGRVRVRFTDESGRAIPIASSSDLAGLAVSPPAEGSFAAMPTSLDRGLALGVVEAPKAPEKPLKPQKKAPEAPPAPIEPAPEHALVAAILRTLGGAEDARSPRAPGLLDTVAGKADVTPDRLAMAGWISPFGANRSGWLNLARAKAAKEGDRASEGFALRRIVASHITAGHVDWALALVQQEPLRSATDAEARLLRAMLTRQVGGSGMARGALDEALAVDRDLGEKTPTSVLGQIAEMASNLPEVALAARERVAQRSADGRGASFVIAHQTRGGAALEAAAARALAQQTNDDELLGIGRALLDAGRDAWAREVFYYATQVAPNRAAAFQGLAEARQAVRAQEIVRGAPPSEAAELAAFALLRAADLEPSDARLKAELAFRFDAGSGEDGGPEARTAMRDEAHLVPPSVFLALAKNNPAKKGEVSGRQLHWVRAVTYHDDKRVSQLMHYSREIVLPPRTEDDLYERDVPTEGDETELLLARVHKRDGTTLPPEEQSSGGGRPMIRWPSLEPGDVVEVAVRSWTAGPVGRRGDAPFYFMDWVGSIDTQPILWNEVVVDSPDGSPLAIDVLNGAPDRVSTDKKDGRTITKYVWDNPPSVPDEPLAPQLSETVPMVVGSTFATWDEFRTWYRGAVEGFTQPDDQVRRLASELTAGKKTEQDKIRALFDFVADDIRYVNYVSGEWWLPNRPQQLLARRQGDCDDKAILLITLLRSIGIEATEVLVQTRYTGQRSVLLSQRAAIPLFDHGIAFLPGKNGAPGTWLDATSAQSRLGPVPAMDARTLALFVDEGPAKIIETPASSPADHGIDATWTMRLTASGAGDLVAKERHSGDSAFELRMNLQEADARAQWVEGYLANGWFSAVQVKPDVTFAPDLPNGNASLGYEARSEALARREGRELAVPLSGTTTLTSQLAPLVKRTLPVVLPPSLAPGHETHAITIEAPKGLSVAELPPGGDEPGGDFGSARIEFKRGPNKGVVIVRRSLIFDLSTIPVDRYPAWRSWLQRVDRLMHQTVRLVPNEKP